MSRSTLWLAAAVAVLGCDVSRLGTYHPRRRLPPMEANAWFPIRHRWRGARCTNWCVAPHSASKPPGRGCSLLGISAQRIAIRIAEPRYSTRTEKLSKPMFAIPCFSR